MLMDLFKLNDKDILSFMCQSLTEYYFILVEFISFRFFVSHVKMFCIIIGNISTEQMSKINVHNKLRYEYHDYT